MLETISPIMVRTRESKASVAARALKHPSLITGELNNRSLYHFLQYFWYLVSPHEFQGNWHIEYLCKELEKLAYDVANKKPREYDLIINVPPGSTKTITCSIMFPAWCWTQWYWMRFITASYSAELSLESAEYCRELIRSREFQSLYPELDIKQDKDTKSNFKIIKKKYTNPEKAPQILVGGSRYSTSVGGTLTGFHGDILIIDDPLDPKRAASEVELQKANRWCGETLSTRKTNKAVTPTVYIMQRLHQDDPSGHILNKQKKNVRHVCIPGEIRNYKHKVSPPELIKFYKNDLLDVIRSPWSVLEDMESDLGQYGYAGQVGQDPTPPGGGMFKVDHFQMVDRPPEKSHIINTVRYWDKAGTEGGKGAFTAGVKMCQTLRGWTVLDVKRGRWGTHEREDIILETARADDPDVEIWVEQEPGSGGKESAQGTVRNLGGFIVQTERPTGNKEFRADPYSVQVNHGNVSLLIGMWNREYVEELRFFPFSTYKDQTDASSGAFSKLVAKKMIRRIL